MGSPNCRTALAPNTSRLMSSTLSDLDVLMVDAGRHQGIAIGVAHLINDLPGVRLHALSDVKMVTLRWSRSRKTFTYIPFETDDEWFQAVADVVASRRIDVILAVSEEGIRFVTAYLDKLSALATVAPVPTTEALALGTNKGRLAVFAAEQGIRVPTTALVTHEGLSNGSLEAEIERIGAPVLVKATSMSAGKGIERFESVAAALSHLRSLPAIEPDSLIVQEIVGGEDLCCVVLCQHGEVVAHSSFRGVDPVESHYSPWTRMLFHENEEVMELTQRITRLLDWNGNANLDFRRTPAGEHVLLELNGRYDGRTRGSMISGVNFAKLHLEMALGIAVSQPDYDEGLYLNLRGVVEESVARLRRRPHADFAYRRTVLPFLLADPIPEVLRVLRGRVPGLR